MIAKLIIAGIKWTCKVPDAFLNKSILRFSSDFLGNEDINMEIRYTDCFDIPEGASITDEVLEWYLYKDSHFLYHLLKREENNGDIIVSMKANESWSDILIEIKCDSIISIQMTNILLIEIAFRNHLHFHEGLVIHSSAIEYKGDAIAFAAPSGTGKSTHVRLWQETYDVRVINDDHPAVRIIDGKPIIFGSPWAGEANKFNNISSALKGIVILEQGDSNKIWRLNNIEILRELLPRCFLPYYSNGIMMRALRIFNELVNNITVYKLTCKPEKEAVMLVKNNVWPNE